MRAPGLYATLALVVSLSGLVPVACAGDHPAPRAGAGRLELAVHYDFFLCEGSRVNDASGKKHDGTLIHGALVEGRRRNAVRFDGQGMIRVNDPQATLDPTSRSLTVGAVCNPSSADGVIASMGDRTDGFSLYVKRGIPHFVVRCGGKLTQVADVEPIPIDQWTHLIGGLDENGEAWLIVNGYLTAHARSKQIPRRPAGPLCIGADPGAPVGDYSEPMNWNGLLQEVRLYWGFIDLKANREDMKDWADLSGCGCK